MGILGVQVVVTMIVASFLHKLSPYYSFGRWLAVSDMWRFLPPRDSQLYPYVNAPGAGARSIKKKATGGQNGKPLDGNYTVPKSSTMKLTRMQVTVTDIQQVPYFPEFRWLMDVTVATLAVYISTCIYYSIRISAIVTEYNLSVIWMIALFLYSVSPLISLTTVYFDEEMSRERSVIIVFATLFFVFALGILLIDENILHFRLSDSHSNITQCVGNLLHSYIVDVDQFVLIPLWAFKMILAIIASFLSSILIFPCFRYSEIQFNIVMVTSSVVTKGLVRLCYLMPLFCLGLWIKPFTKDIFSELDSINILGQSIYHETFRHWSVLAYCALRTALFKLHLQNFLNLASLRVQSVQRERGRITIRELRKKVSTVFSYYGGVTIQYMAPILIVLSLSILMHMSSPYQKLSLTQEQLEIDPGTNVFKTSGFGLSLFHGCISFLCWWVCFTLFIASGFGSALQGYI